MFNTNAAYQNGKYGISKFNEKTQQYYFVELGDLITLTDVEEDIETGAIDLILEFDYMGSTKYVTVPRSKITDPSFMEFLASQGGDVTKKNFNTLVDVLRMQERAFYHNKKFTTKIYHNVGWMYYYETDPVTSKKAKNLCYRSHTLIGAKTAAEYRGSYATTPTGSYDVWKAMVEEYVLGHTRLEVALLAGLSGITNGLLALDKYRLNPILHIYGSSGTGKSTCGMLATSVYGKAFDSTEYFYNKYNMPEKKRSFYGSWGATENAIITSQAGNMGTVSVLNEFGKFLGNNLLQVIYNLSEGSDKLRLNASIKAQSSDTYRPSFISIGEVSLLEKCKSDLEGARIRVMELEGTMTDSDKQADYIQEISIKNNGHAAPIFAQYILDNGGLKYVKGIYKKQCDMLKTYLPNTPSKSRFIDTFPGLFLATAEIAKDALGLEFNIEALKEFFYDYEQSVGKNRNTATTCYDKLLEHFRTNIGNFYRKGESQSPKTPWGKINSCNKVDDNGRKIVEEYIVYPYKFKEILHELGYTNHETAIKELKKIKVLSHEKDRNTRSRKIDPNGNPVEAYVLNAYASEKADSDDDTPNIPRKKVVTLPKKAGA